MSQNAPGPAGPAKDDTALNSIYAEMEVGDTYTLNPFIEQPPAAAEKIDKGDVIVDTDDGMAPASATNVTAGRRIGVATTSVDNSSGTAGGVSIPSVLRQGQRVAAMITGPVEPQNALKVGDDADFDPWVPGTDATNLIVAKYVGQDAGVYVADNYTVAGQAATATTPTGERFNANSAPEVAITAASGGIGIVELL